MSLKFWTLSFLALCVSLPAISARASDRDEDVARVQKAAQVFHQIMNTPDKGVPQRLLNNARCIAIIPGDVKFAFILGGNYGRGVASCRDESGWSAPIFLAVEGGSVGYQAGGSSTDLVMLFMNEEAMQKLLGDKFKIGVDASGAAGPVGRDLAAGTDIRLEAEILTYSRSHGLFAGASLDGTVVQADKSGDKAMYGPEANRHDILDGRTPVPQQAEAWLRELSGNGKESARVNH